MPYAKNVCRFAGEPKAGRECMEAINSMGRACKKCEMSCYRKGWTAQRATTDNRRLVRERRGWPVTSPE